MAHRNYVDLQGKMFGRLTVILSLGLNIHNKTVWKCLCDCGKEKDITASSLIRGLTNSCGCFRSEVTTTRLTKHGQAKVGLKTSEYKCWKGITQRCENPNDSAYQNYGGRGVTICERWKSFDNFYADMGEKPSPKHSIERKNVNGNYSPDNCRWATYQEQAQNRRVQNTNKSGISGVRWDNQHSVWLARIDSNNKRIHLGTFKILDEAIEARKQAEIKYWNKQPS